MIRARILAFALALLGVTALRAQTIYLSDPITVANGAVYGTLRPQVSLDRAGNPVVAWGSSVGGRKAYATTWNGSGFNVPTRISPSGSIAAYSVEGPNLATAGDTLYVVYCTAPMSTGKGMLRSSFDRGVTWNTPVEVDSLNPDMSGFIHVTTDANRNPIVMYMRHNSSMAEPRYVIRRSFDAGQTFAPEVDASGVAPGNDVCDCCTGRVYARPNGDIWAVFRNNINNRRDSWATRSTDGGLTFTQASDLDSTDWLLTACPSSGPSSLFALDSIHTVFMSEGGDGLPRIYVSSAHVDSASSAWNMPLPDSMAATSIQNYPAIAGNADTMGVVYYYRHGTNSEVQLAWSTSGSAGLLSHPSVNASAAIGVQTTPDIAFRNGVFHMVWTDNATADIIYRQAAFYPLVGLPSAKVPQFSVSPHPVLHAAVVQFEEIQAQGAILKLLDLQGRVLRVEPVSGMQSVQFTREGLPSGTYFLQLQGEGATPAVRKLLLR